MKPTFFRTLFLIAVLAPSGMVHAQGGERIAVFTKNQTNPFFQSFRLGADSAGKQLNVRITHYVPTKPDSIPEQMSQVEDVIVKKPDAIVFTPVDYKAMTPAVAKMNAANIPVVNALDRVEGAKFISFVGSSDHQIGLETARALAKAMGGKGNVVILEGVKGTLTSVDRVKGATDALKAFPEIRIVASQPANYQRLQALQVMENLMQSHPAIDGVFAANDAMAAGVIEALAGASRKALVVGINGSAEAIEAIKSGKMLASGDYNGFNQGCAATMVSIRHLRKQPMPASLIFPAMVIDKTNFRAWDTPVEQRTCPSWDVLSKP